MLFQKRKEKKEAECPRYQNNSLENFNQQSTKKLTK